MTFTPEQLSEVERRMEEEHRKDREALLRLKRFLDLGEQTSVITIHREEDSSNVDDTPTIISKVESVFADDFTRKWTVPTMIAHLRHEGFPLVAQKPEATMGQVFARLQQRGVIRLVRRGAGRRPNIFKAVAQTKEEEKSEASQSERATQGQPVAVN